MSGGRDGDPAGPAEERLLRAALEMAVHVARADRAATPPRPVPRSLNAILRFRRLPPPAWHAVRLALDDDDFREHVATRIDEEEVGRAGWLFLVRPERWRVEFDELVATNAAELGSEDADVDTALPARQQRKLASMRARLDEATAQHHQARAELTQALAETDRLRSALDAALDEARRASEERVRAVRELKATEDRLARRTAELREVREALESDGARAARCADPDVPAPAAEPQPSHEVGEFAAARLRGLLGELSAALDEYAPPARSSDRPAVGGGRGDGGTARAVTPAGSAGQAVGRRRPRRCDRGLLEGSAEFVTWLIGEAGVRTIVDGYNVTMRHWSHLSVPEQRRALEQAACRLALRTGASIEIVFDGAGERVTRRHLRGADVVVRFTIEGVEADDEILAMVAALPPSTPVVVVSSDRRVADGAAALGANVVATGEFLDART
ncbi:MAG TPA: NYN domain-containing protein [Microthrixaceae bacterium]|nr:NYN domain-containing protein [Microthrixaceae bacterium]HMS12215.1 NYN domain-containing protein [Microthrixaceae bacterium]HMT25356.1 NYN domain-containing protein [Microthrixaceae bacterium]HMT61303.1 NYN domain-containing protein [Microthrixaceae bacterium]